MSRRGKVAESGPRTEHNPLSCPHERVDDCATRLLCKDCGASGYINPRPMLGKAHGPLFYWVGADSRKQSRTQSRK